MRSTALLALCLGSFVGCATYHDDLERGQHYYEVSQYPNALAIWRTLELDLDSLSYPEQARYSYLRGMTDYRMGFRADARHWLAVSRAIDQKHPGGLESKSIADMERVLSELNAAVYAMGPPPSAAATGIELTNVSPGASASQSAVPTSVAPPPPAQSAAQRPVPPSVAPVAVPAPASAAPAAQPAVLPPRTAPPLNTTTTPSVPPPSNVPPPSGL